MIVGNNVAIRRYDNSRTRTCQAFLATTLRGVSTEKVKDGGDFRSNSHVFHMDYTINSLVGGVDETIFIKIEIGYLLEIGMDSSCGIRLLRREK